MQQILSHANIQIQVNENNTDESNDADDEEETEFIDEPIEDMEWLQFDPHDSLLPLIITAIREHKSQ